MILAYNIPLGGGFWTLHTAKNSANLVNKYNKKEPVNTTRSQSQVERRGHAETTTTLYVMVLIAK